MYSFAVEIKQSTTQITAEALTITISIHKFVVKDIQKKMSNDTASSALITFICLKLEIECHNHDDLFAVRWNISCR